MSEGMDRRSFLKGTAFTAIGAAIAGSMAGCASEKDAPRSGQELSSTDGSKLDYDSFETDLIIVGGGNAASAAAWSALRSGNQRIIMIEKGPLQSSGHTNTSWAGFNSYVDIDTETPNFHNNVLTNAPMARNALAVFKEGGRDFDHRNRGVTMINHGQYIPSRDEKGEIIAMGGTMCLWQWFRHELDGVLAKDAISVLDQTMITDVIVEDNRCCGVVGLHLPTGRLRVIRSKATVVATSGACINYGRLGVHAVSAHSVDSTFDVESALYRRGVGLTEAEFGSYDVYNVEPRALGVTAGLPLVVDADSSVDSLVLENGELVFSPDDDKVGGRNGKPGDRNYFGQVIGKAVHDNGSVYLDIRDDPTKVWTSEHTLTVLKDFGFDLTQTRIAAAPELFDHGGVPICDENNMTDIEGLFWVRSAGTVGEVGGASLLANHLFGNYTGYRAAEYAADCDAVPSFDWTQVADEYNRLVAVRTATNGNGLRPCAIRHSIQEAFYKGFGTYRTREDLESSLSELERIKNEDMPRQIVGDDSPVWNKDWKEALENECLLLNAEMSVRATLMREESRGGYLRDDFPEKDDENWACWVVCKKNGDEMVLEKQDLPADAQ